MAQGSTHISEAMIDVLMSSSSAIVEFDIDEDGSAVGMYIDSKISNTVFYIERCGCLHDRAVGDRVTWTEYHNLTVLQRPAIIPAGTAQWEYTDVPF